MPNISPVEQILALDLPHSRQRLVSLTPRGRAMQEKAKDIPTCLSRKWEGNNPSIEEIVAMTKTLDSMIETLKQ